ncbi:SRPBCC family protein [Kineobactrum sediminis]|uniref:SRPBCC family protein n=1 Tax=Kineobactrum sediminis TaxID=1905677 RepID=A0A2N5XYH9_9GAMM|nr:SRPBCC family protein [Kineobactrum sediminis]PLW81182.1 SRPBCC family protein [Kineobactrum sediminis]
MSQELSAQTLIDLPVTEAWAKLRDISLAHNYVPGIVKTVIVSENSEGPGASRYVYRNGKSYIQETVEEWHEGKGFLIRLHRGDKPAPPFRKAWFRYALEGNDSGQTLFTATLEYEMPWGRLGDWLGRRMAGVVGATLADVAIAMKLYYETGQPTTAAALKAYTARPDATPAAVQTASGRSP